MNWNDARIILHLLRGQSRTGSHAQRLETFYAPQAEHYDAFRERLLHGRKELIAQLNPLPGAHIVELGGGTGRNLLYFGETLSTLGCVEVVDLCASLLKEARERTKNYPNVRVIEADAVTYKPEQLVDCVYFSYAITMIPDWHGAINNAYAMLKPDGSLGVVDFYVSSKCAESNSVQHGWFTRWFWPRWFGHDGVRLNPEHLSTLRKLFPDHKCFEKLAPVPYLPGLRVPYYIFIGKKVT
jgi:S-adenosylmethionine-diacylgycerolhomoserine-N-methlytransferase